MEDQVPTAPAPVLSPAGSAPAGVLKSVTSVESMRATLGASYTWQRLARSITKDMDKSFGAAARKAVLGDGIAKRFDYDGKAAQMAGEHSKRMKDLASTAMLTSGITEHMDRLAQLGSGGVVAQLAAAGSFGAVVPKDLVKDLTGLGAAVAGLSTVLGSSADGYPPAIEKAHGYQSLIEKAYQQQVEREQAFKGLTSTASFAKSTSSVDVFKGVVAGIDTKSLMRAAGLTGDVAVAPWVPSPRREVDLFVAEPEPLVPGEQPAFAGYQGMTGLQLDLKRLHQARDAAETDPLRVLTPSASLIESACKYVLNRLVVPLTGTETYEKLVYLTTKALGIHPEHLTDGLPVKKLFGASMDVIQQIGVLRNKTPGSGAHGCYEIEPDFHPEHARIVAQEAIDWQTMVVGMVDRRLG